MRSTAPYRTKGGRELRSMRPATSRDVGRRCAWNSLNSVSASAGAGAVFGRMVRGRTACFSESLREKSSRGIAAGLAACLTAPCAGLSLLACVSPRSSARSSCRFSDLARATSCTNSARAAPPRAVPCMLLLSRRGCVYEERRGGAGGSMKVADTSSLSSCRFTQGFVSVRVSV